MSSDDICAKSSGVISRVRTEDVRIGLFLSFKVNIRDRIQCLYPPWLERLGEGGRPVFVVCLLIVDVEDGLFYLGADGLHV